MPTKVCRGCLLELPTSQFYSHYATADRLRPKCKRCLKIETASWREANPDKVKEFYRRNDQRPERKAAHAAREHRRYRDHPLHYKAVCAVNHAIRDGKLVRQPCFKCSAVNAEAHHEDYSRPFDIVWACKPHHIELDHARRERLCQ